MSTTKYKSNSPTLKPILGITQFIIDREGDFCTLRFSKFTSHKKQNDTCWPSGSVGGLPCNSHVNYFTLKFPKFYCSNTNL